MFAVRTFLAALLLAPLAAPAADQRQCEHSRKLDLQLDFSGIETVVFDIGSHTLDARAAGSGSGRVQGQACASSGKRLERMKLVQDRSGSTLTVRALRDGESDNGLQLDLDLFGKSFKAYALMTLEAQVPANVMVQLRVGSGEARLQGARSASVEVGSGEVEVSRIAESVTAKVGSGDFKAQDIGALEILSVGSGDAGVRGVRGASTVGSVGSGDLEISSTRGGVEVGSVGSGDADLRDIGGDVTVGSIGSGDLRAHGVRGNLQVRSVGSGDVGHRGVTGSVDLPRGH